jgi:hypothetical protein
LLPNENSIGVDLGIIDFATFDYTFTNYNPLIQNGITSTKLSSLFHSITKFG